MQQQRQAPSMSPPPAFMTHNSTQRVFHFPPDFLTQSNMLIMSVFSRHEGGMQKDSISMDKSSHGMYSQGWFQDTNLVPSDMNITTPGAKPKKCQMPQHILSKTRIREGKLSVCNLADRNPIFHSEQLSPQQKSSSLHTEKRSHTTQVTATVKQKATRSITNHEAATRAGFRLSAQQINSSSALLGQSPCKASGRASTWHLTHAALCPAPPHWE